MPELEARGSVRFRTTAAAAAVVGVALLIASVALILFLRRSLTEDVRLAARVRAEAVAHLVADSGPRSIRIASDDDEFVQVLDSSGRVVAASSNVGEGAAVARLQPGQSVRLELPFDDDPFLAVAVSAERGGTVIVGRTLDVVVESTQTILLLLLVGVPLLLLLVVAVTQRVVGSALDPVEAIRSEVEGISSTQLDRRVPVPGSGDEIARLAETMNRMLERLERGQERQRRFVSDASHELRSPVAALRQHAEVAMAHPARVPAEELARTVLEENARIQQLVEDLLLLARMDERAHEKRAQEVDLDDIVLAEIDRVRRVNGKPVDAGKVSAGRVLGDPRTLTRVVGNLLDNAVRHARSAVSVSVFEHDGEVVLQVDDDGPGIPAKDRERVFERFVRLDHARDREAGGAGLGLSIVAEVATLHGGGAAVLDSPFGGARLEVRLPRAAS